MILFIAMFSGTVCHKAECKWNKDHSNVSLEIFSHLSKVSGGSRNSQSPLFFNYQYSKSLLSLPQ